MMLVTVIRDCGQSFVSGAASLITATVDWSAVHRGSDYDDDDDDDNYWQTTVQYTVYVGPQYFSMYSYAQHFTSGRHLTSLPVMMMINDTLLMS